MFECSDIIWFRHSSDSFYLCGIRFETFRCQLTSRKAHIGLCSLYFIAIELQIPFPAPSKEGTFVLLQALVSFFFSITEAGNNEVVCNDFYSLKDPL